MPIYAYRCDSCGHTKDVLQKISDPVLQSCPVCGAETFNKQLTAAGFQLKGSGWYATDFKGGAKSGASSGTVEKATEKGTEAASSSASAAHSCGSGACGACS